MASPDSLDAKLDTLIGGLEALDRALGDETKARQDAIKAVRRQRNLMLTVILVGVALALLLAVGGLFVGAAAHSANTKSDQAVELARVGACRQDNIRIDQHNALVNAAESQRSADIQIQTEIDQLVGFASTTPDGVTLTPAQQARLGGFTKLAQAQQSAVDDLLDAAGKNLAGSEVARRDCTVDGIKAYLAHS